MSESFPKRYDFREVEERWRRTWEEWGIYKFDREDQEKPTYSIDTPPPYPSGELHVGNALNFAYIDFVARYKRMRGFNVLFPQGWDCHGLPTEVRVERITGKKKSEFRREEFLELAKKYTLEWIKPMKEALKALGCSIDWSLEYMTMDPDYWRRTQLSFIIMYEKGFIYRAEHPVIWCPRCETAIAESEVEYEERERELYYFKFKVVNGKELVIASTRPELLASCVAVVVHPEDERYVSLIGEKALVPIYEREVPIISDKEVDKEFGTGAVMLCTYGDRMDVKWQKKHGLPVIISINDKGLMNENAGFLKGIKIEEARKKIVEELKRRGLLVKIEKIRSSIGKCWRCHTPVEIIPKKQWFVSTRKLASKVLEEGKKIRWIPEHAYKRLEDWIKSLDWDWVISRQRMFATPIPVYYCEECGNVIVAKPDWLPIDPRKDPPKVKNCPKCGSTKIRGETDVLDTWMDSSITAAVHAGWPDKLDERLFPADLQPNGYDIIRTWDYYLLVRGIALFNKTQFKVALINGMVRGIDGRMMHKSYGNYVSLMEVLKKYGADAFRLWASFSAATGSDIRFSWEGVDYARRFLTKLWNASRFAYIILKDFDPKTDVPNEAYRITDKWILSLSKKLVKDVTYHLENFDFMGAVTALINFIWHKLCDHYLEAIKYRVSSEDSIDKKAAQKTLYEVLLTVLRLLSVFTPYITEEIYHKIFFKHERWKSITISPWPKLTYYKEEDIKEGDIVINTIASMRRAKHEMNISLKDEIALAIINVGRKEYLKPIKSSLEDIKGTLRIEEIKLFENKKEGLRVEKYPEITFILKR